MAKYRNVETATAVDAMQFDSQACWPACVHSWREANYQPRDMSWGFVQTAQGRKHVLHGDYIIYYPNSTYDVCKEAEFHTIYKRVAEAEVAHGI